ncbi:MAG: hypothetical protein SFU85_05175 [Candidatus Methylacidiphilales bacterium]|nr:hypothetical protein [Candidatus Methylacidiphilales bacterium]
MNPLSADLRKRIIAARKKGHRIVDIVEHMEVSRSSVVRLWNQFTQQGHYQPKQQGGYLRSRLEGHDSSLRQWIAHRPDLTLEEIKERCRTELGVVIGKSAVADRLVKLGLSFKKNPARCRARAARH